ncbi:cell division ATP-binding protein FtsE [Roseibium sp. TrichSKD4]|uniref:DUF1127 domain-containing protein n=1 Tax=Roseibium sp. TrichSKD4 TaxID=744980 RepID=UPI0001E5625E|nr:DUF1127 domain-containing protein [Roseibium sp. TrichSKD4]EFO32973.1 cell division ATP-binding protein FtsE [Roseibium sp. TrichSKD4]
MSFYEQQHLVARIRGRGLLFDLGAKMVEGFAVAYHRRRTQKALSKLDHRLLDDVGLERGLNGVYQRRKGPGE